jgi:hypothetical protein
MAARAAQSAIWLAARRFAVLIPRSLYVMQKPKTPVSRDGLTREPILEYCAGPRAGEGRGTRQVRDNLAIRGADYAAVRSARRSASERSAKKPSLERQQEILG